MLEWIGLSLMLVFKHFTTFSVLQPPFMERFSTLLHAWVVTLVSATLAVVFALLWPNVRLILLLA